MVKFSAHRAGNFTMFCSPDIFFPTRIRTGQYFINIPNYPQEAVAKMDGKKRKSSFDFIIELLAYLAGIILLVMTFVVTGAALMRYLGFRPPIWTLQFTEYALLWFTFLGAAWLLREGGHIRIDTLITRLYIKNRHKVEIINDVLGFIVCVIVFWFGTQHSIDLYQREIMEVKGTIVPKFPIFLIIPIGGLALSIQFGRQFFQKIKSSPGHEDT
jgi:TRAP-type C4-dicarboxylate transport system permease small subunit